jgi:hypothetical protein
MTDALADAARRLALAASLTRGASRAGDLPTDAEGLLAAARALADVSHRDVRFEPPYPGASPGPERAGGRLRVVLACTARGPDGREIGTVFTTLIAGRRVTVSVAPPGTPIDPSWKPLAH